jgi:hypothetical protein
MGSAAAAAEAPAAAGDSHLPVPSGAVQQQGVVHDSGDTPAAAAAAAAAPTAGTAAGNGDQVQQHAEAAQVAAAANERHVKAAERDPALKAPGLAASSSHTGHISCRTSE